VLAEVACAGSRRCACDALLPEAAATGVEACTTVVEESCPLAMGSSIRQAVDMGMVDYDPVAAGRYLDALRNASCDGSPPLCDGPCLGSGLQGERCDEVHGCDGGLSCIEGTCRRMGGGLLAAGAECMAPEQCESAGCEGGRCAMARPDGDACSDDRQCMSGHCDFGTGRCRPPEQNGILCAEHADCQSGYCPRDDRAAGLCADKLTDGSECIEDAACMAGACVNGTCNSPVCQVAIDVTTAPQMPQPVNAMTADPMTMDPMME
jgi:hypothetical protein